MSSSSRVEEDRFARYFPALFAFASSFADETSAREIVIDSFSRAFERPATRDEGDFRLVLFAIARDICASTPSRPRATDDLSPREREIVSLLFDAQLSRGEVACVLGASEDSVTAELIRALKKLRDTVTGGGIPAFLRPSTP